MLESRVVNNFSTFCIVKDTRLI